MSAAHLLELRGVTQRFGGLVAVDDLSLTIDAGEIVAMIGPNGAGKSTAFNLVTGIYRPSAGSIVFAGHEIAGAATSRIAAAGIARTFQNIRLFGYASALENVVTGEHARLRSTLLDSLLHTPKQRREERAAFARGRELLAFVGLAAQAEIAAHDLSYGHQRALEIARALASEPNLLLLDEPAAGMNPSEKRGLATLIRRVRDELGVTVFLVEHDVALVMSLSDRVVVLDHGERIAVGTPTMVQADPRVIEAYLGAPV